jgi:predicted RNA-binding Zn ribbon-like protein
VPNYLFLANNPALDFVNTEVVLSGKPTDLMQSFAELTEWFAKAGLASMADMDRLAADWDGSKEGSAALRAARGLRGLLRSCLEKLSQTGHLPGTLAPCLNEHLKNPRLATKVANHSGKLQTELHWLFEKPADLIVPLAHHAAQLFATADYSAIRKCEDPNCVLWFHDTSKNHSRRWCSMELCGNRAKVAAFRERT